MPRKDSDPYEVLGLDRGATAAEVRAAYLRLAKKYHPDKNPGDKATEWIFWKIQRAYETLSVANDVRPGEQERPSTAQQNNVRRQAERARQRQQQAEEAEREEYEQWEHQQAEDARRRWERERSNESPRSADEAEPVCDHCGSVARWWTRLPRTVRLSGTQVKKYVLGAVALGFAGGINAYLFMPALGWLLRFTDWSSSLLGEVVIIVMGLMLVIGSPLLALDRLGVCSRCGRVSLGRSGHLSSWWS